MELFQGLMESIAGKAAFAKEAFRIISRLIKYSPQNLWEGIFKLTFLGALVLASVQNGVFVAFLGNVFMGRERRTVYEKILTWMIRIGLVGGALLAINFLSIRMMGVDLIF